MKISGSHLGTNLLIDTGWWLLGLFVKYCIIKPIMAPYYAAKKIVERGKRVGLHVWSIISINGDQFRLTRHSPTPIHT